MKRLVSDKPSLLIKALIPGLAGLGMLAIESVITHYALLHDEQLQTEMSKNNLYHQVETGSNWFVASIYGVSKDLRKTLFEAYDNYFAFLIIMLIVNVCIHASDILRHALMKRNKTLFSYSENSQEFLKKILRALLVYSMMFCFYQTIWIGLTSSSIFLETLHEARKNPVQNAGEHIQRLEMMLPSRILEKQDEVTAVSPLNDANVKKRPSLSIGKLLGQVDVYAVSIELSKDGNTAFVTTIFPQTFKIIDISDPEYPVVLSTLNFPKHTFEYVFKSILVAPDETKLYISNIEYLQVVDITNFKSPNLVAFVFDPDYGKTSPKYNSNAYAKPNLLLSRDNKFLFVSGYGLQIFDVSGESPALVSSVSSRISSGYLVPASVALSEDQKTLYYSDGGLWVYNVEDPRNMKILSSFNMTNPITSMLLSNDAKTAFVLSQNRQANILLQKLDLSDIASIKTSGKEIKFDKNSTCQPIFLKRTPDNLFVIILFKDANQVTYDQALIFDTQGGHLLNNRRIFVRNPFAVTFTEDYKRVFVGNSVGKLEIVDLFLDYPNKHAFAESKNIIQTFPADCDFFTLSKKKKDFLYCMKYDFLDSTNFFRIHQISSSNNSLSQVAVFEDPETHIQQMIVSEDHRRAFWVAKNKIIIMNISSVENIKKLGEYIVVGESTINYLAVSKDGKTGYLTLLEAKVNYFEIVDFSEIQNIIKRSSVKLGSMTDFAMPVLSHDERTVFIMLNKMMVYNVSEPADPKLLTSLSFLQEELYLIASPVLAILSPDSKTLFVKDESSLNDDRVHIIDVSDVTSPQIQSDFRCPIVAQPNSIYPENFILFSTDSKTIYIARPESILVVDVSSLNSPKHLGSIRVMDHSILDYVKDFSISEDGRKAFVLTKEKQLHIVAIDPVYSTFITQDTLMLGERYRTDLQVLKMNEYMEYERIEADYRFVKFALVENHAIQNRDFENVVMKVPPSWMTFDLKTQTLSVEARRKNDIRSYQVYFGFSTQIAMEAFSGINNTIKSEDLVSSLLALGYIDSQRFLTEDFGELKDFILPSEYSLIKEKVYKILKGYSFGTFNELKIIESLGITVEEESKIKISTASGANLKVEINLRGEAQFLSRHYGSLIPMIPAGLKSRLIMEGSLKDVNLALREIVINLPKGRYYDGEIIIDDKLNPVRVESVKNISRLFNHNQSPGLNKNFSLTLQDQVDKELVWTGQYFHIKLNQKTFFDNYTDVENLNYQLVYMKDGKNETTVLPTWISFSDMTLTGTAPEEILNRDFEFKLVVKNEFRELKVPLAIHVKISSNFVLKLLMKYSPYVLSIVGLWISANKIFNVVFKSTYKHPKDFHVRTDQEITSEVIFPVSFVRGEIGEAKKILEKLIGARDKKEFLSYFMMENGERRICKSKVLESIKLSLGDLSHQEKKSFSLYLEGKEGRRGGLHPRELINQIVFNNLTKRLLDTEPERETKRDFEEIKKEWWKFVEWDLVNSCFKINNEKFETGRIKGSILTNNDDLRTSLIIEESGISLDLLKDAILAYAFECQNIDIHPVSAQLRVKERKKTKWWKTFLKLDLRDSPLLEKGKIGYGIGFTKEYNSLCFNGVVKPDIMNKTIVIQITNSKQKILKELWVYGNSECEEESVIDRKSEIEAKGKDYEIF